MTSRSDSKIQSCGFTVLGISAFFHDSAAALIKDGEIVAAVQEERFSRIKHDSSFPVNAIKACLDIGDIALQDIDTVVFFEKPFVKFERIVETSARNAPFGLRQFLASMPVWLTEKLFQKSLIENELLQIDSLFSTERLKFSDHHLSHAASAFFPSPFEEAAIVTLDGVGEWATATIAHGKGNDLRVLKEINFPDSIGLLYSAFTHFCGFKVNSGEYKLMGLAPYGEPRYASIIRDNLIDIRDDGSFRLDMRYFGYTRGLEMVNKRFAKLFGFSRRLPETEIDQKYMDMAASIQVVCQEVVLKICKEAIVSIGETKNLCLAGGVALNCVANGELAKSNICDDLWVQPAAGDAGGALGAAFAYYYLVGKRARPTPNGDSMQGSYLGREYSDYAIQELLDEDGWVYQELEPDALSLYVAELLADGLVIGRFCGREEFGPRALGNRSILADPAAEDMQRKLNLKIKFREGFRPFAPAVLAENTIEWFDIDRESPYMLLTAPVTETKRVKYVGPRKTGLKALKAPRSEIQAVTHVDFSARLQTVTRESNAPFYDILAKFAERTGRPVLVNTSFNVRGEPIVSSPQDALFCFEGTGMDALIIGRFVLKKDRQIKRRDVSYPEAVLVND